MTIWAPKLHGHACTKIPYKGYDISIAMDDSCGAMNSYSRSRIAVYKDGSLLQFFGNSAECDATAENLKVIFARIDELEKA